MTNVAKLPAAAITEIKIEKGVPIPRKGLKYPWPEMEVGDSFAFFPNLKPVSAYAATHNASKAYAPRKFEARRDADGNMRCWRVA